MKLSVTILAGSYRASDREIIMRQPFIEQPGDLVVTVTAEGLPDNAPVKIRLEEMLRQAEGSVARMTMPLRNQPEGPQ